MTEKMSSCRPDENSERYIRWRDAMRELAERGNDIASDDEGDEEKVESGELKTSGMLPEDYAREYAC